jgi:hypothetical protein
MPSRDLKGGPTASWGERFEYKMRSLKEEFSWSAFRTSIEKMAGDNYIFSPFKMLAVKLGVDLGLGALTERAAGMGGISFTDLANDWAKILNPGTWAVGFLQLIRLGITGGLQTAYNSLSDSGFKNTAKLVRGVEYLADFLMGLVITPLKALSTAVGMPLDLAINSGIRPLVEKHMEEKSKPDEIELKSLTPEKDPDAFGKNTNQGKGLSAENTAMQDSRSREHTQGKPKLEEIEMKPLIPGKTSAVHSKWRDSVRASEAPEPNDRTL